MEAQELYPDLRPGAFAIPYRMLGSVSEAEDVVQEGLLRLHRALEDGELESPRAYLSTVVTRLAIDELRSARARRETYVGESPEQRGVFLLREVFDYPYDRIAEILGTSEAATRQIATRARRQVDDRRPRYEASQRRREELAERFFAGVGDGDLETLESLLAETSNCAAAAAAAGALAGPSRARHAPGRPHARQRDQDGRARAASSSTAPRSTASPAR